MQIEILSKEKQPLYFRQEVKFVVSESKTPKKEDVRKKIAALHNANEENVIVQSISNKYGDKNFSGIAKIYDSKEKMELIEPEHLVARNFGKKEAPKQEKK